jgi:hypothetical protein
MQIYIIISLASYMFREVLFEVILHRTSLKMATIRGLNK